MTWSPPATYTERQEIGSFGPSAAATKQLASGAATGTLSFTSTHTFWDAICFTVTITEGGIDLLPTGITTGETFGTPSITVSISPSSVTTGEALGIPRITLSVSPSSIASLESFGTSFVDAGLRPEGIPSGEAFGTAVVKRETFVFPSGIVSEESLGSPTLVYNQSLTVDSVASEEAFGDASLATLNDFRPLGIESLEFVSIPTVSRGHEYIFRPPTVQETPAGGGILFARYGVHRGISVIKRADGSIYSTRYPALTDLEEADKSWLGGYKHVLTDEDNAELVAAGYGSNITLERVS